VPVTADERYFLVRTTESDISRDGHTDLERQMMGQYLWWGRDALMASAEIIFPADIAALLDTSAAGEA